MAIPLSGIGFRLLKLFHVWLVVMTLLNVGTLSTATTTSSFVGSKTDRLALLAFKSKITHDPQGVVSSWNNSHHFCEWQGVTCGHRHRRVTVINLSSRGIVGSLSPSIGNLSFLHEFNLNNNTFQGEIPTELGNLARLQKLNLTRNSFEGEIPTNLLRCIDLTELSVGQSSLVGNNKLVGKFPKELTSLSKLTYLVIQANNLTGGISSFIGNLTSLEVISAAKNPFGGSIPDTLGQLKNLRQLGLGGNQLSGMIPSSIYNLSFITVFSVASNQLRGSLPSSFGFKFHHLQLLQLQMNQFTGPLPLSISNFSELEQIQVEYNSFNGKITNNFGNLKKLKKIGLFRNNFGSGEPDELAFLGSLANCSNLMLLGMEVNRFRGVLPASVGNLSSHLFSFIFGRNQIYGTIPSTIGNLVNLTVLSMGNNQLTGTIATNIGNLQKLQRLSFAINHLSGKIPDSMGNLSLLNELYMANNRLEGTIPSSLGNCQNLLSLRLDQNNLSGTIPRELLRVSSLSISLNLARNHLFGSLSTEVGNLKNLGELDISEDRLSGEIPSSLGSCSSLESLYLQENSFQGSIPLQLESLRGIQNIDLSQNNLSGKIPTFLEKFSLMNLNLSFNDFEGDLPMRGVFTNASAISIAGNYRLCGGILELHLPRCTPKKSKPKMPLSHIIAITTASVLVGVTMVSFSIICWFKKRRKTQSTVSSSKESFWKVSYGNLLKATDGFSKANLIGFGSSGSVYKGLLDHDGELVVAIKVLNLQNRGATKSFLAECETLRNIRHRNLVKIITSCSSVDFQGNEFKALVYEFMPNGNLERWLHSSPEINNEQNELQRLNLLQRINIAIDVAYALDYLHHHCQTPIIHCDLKPSNILLDNDMVAHIGDFGLAKFCSEFIIPNQSSSIGVRGTIGYAAPEYGLGSEMSTYGDVYSYGILLLEMITGKRPTDSMFEEGLNIHSFAKMALPQRMMEIVDPVFLNNEKEEERAIEMAAATATNKTWEPIQVNNGDKMVECLISMVKIGVACSIDSPQDRMSSSSILHELHLVKHKLLQKRISD
ncbi:probable LRR receptor-like serine/threonine-protein kinase At3g47570 [Camellia sinensis]|uniref:probable LRR receptor-like serine/threonine-protein kinase At3g47570 n=1 Tax=Camellia sinensis TaxID=4442 RepID=UPI001036CD08|nr:probable LRR receptor-like serine/threonine-protein kinase At3g47570 [Camellia sinensis]